MKSSVPAFKAALVARLQADASILVDAAANGGDMAVCLGNPHPYQAPKTVIVVGPMSAHKYEYVAAMTQANETYDIEVYVSLVDAAANDKQTLVDRTYSLADMVHASVLAWDTGDFHNAEGVKVADDVIPEITSDQDFSGDDAREFAVTLTLHVIARVS